MFPEGKRSGGESTVADPRQDHGVIAGRNEHVVVEIEPAPRFAPFVDGDTGEGVWSYNGRSWEPIEEGPARARDLAGSGDSLMVSGWDEDGEEGIWRYDGRFWSRELILDDDASVSAPRGLPSATRRHSSGVWKAL